MSGCGLIGTSLTAVEIAKITRSLDVLLERPEVDPVAWPWSAFLRRVLRAWSRPPSTRESRFRLQLLLRIQEGRYGRTSFRAERFPVHRSLYAFRDAISSR